MTVGYGIGYASNVAMAIAGVWLALEYHSIQSYAAGFILLCVSISKNRG